MANKINNSISSMLPSVSGQTERFSMESFMRTLHQQENAGTGLMAHTFDMGNEDYTSPATAQNMHSIFGDLEMSLESLNFKDSVTSVDGDLETSTRVQNNMKAAAGFIASVLMNASSESYVRRLKNVAVARPAQDERVALAEMEGPHGYIPTGSLENYDEKPSTGFNVVTVAYNLQAARQDAFGERLYPTMVVAPTEGGISQQMTYTVVFDDRAHKADGTEYDTKEVNLIDGFRDPSILADTVTRAIPVYDEKTNAANFVAPSLVPVTTVEDEFGSYQTAPLRVDKKIDLIGISNRNRWLNAGQMDTSDTLDSAMGLARVYVKVGDKVLSLLVDRLPTSRFQAVREGDSRSMYLAFQTHAPVVTKTTTAVDGTTIPSLAALGDGDHVMLALDITGNVSLSKGTLNISASEVAVHDVLDKNGNAIKTDSGTALELVKAFATAEVIGVDLDARFTNKNRRQRGQIMQTRTLKLRHAIPMGAPISNISSTMDETNDSAIVGGLTAATNVRNSNNAVTTLLNYAANLRQVTSLSSSRRVNPEEIEGIMAVNMNPTYRYAKVDLRDSTDTIRGKDRMDDISATLLNTIRSEVFPAVRDSNIIPAFQVMTGNPDERPLLIIATDNEICNYLMISGDVRTMGANLKYEIVSTQNKLMDGKIICVLTRENPTEGDVLNFGQFLYVPSLVGKLPIARNGAINDEIAVAPFNKHINNIPWMIEIDVVGLKEVAANGASSTTNLNGYDKTQSGSTTTDSTTGTGTTGKNGG